MVKGLEVSTGKPFSAVLKLFPIQVSHEPVGIFAGHRHKSLSTVDLEAPIKPFGKIKKTPNDIGLCQTFV